MLKHIIFALILIGGGYFYWTTVPVSHGPGVMAPKAPQQENTFGIQPIEYKGYELTPQKTYEFQARVLSDKTYYYDDMSKLTPYDFVIGWGPMSDERVINDILVRQSDRSYYIEMSTPPIPQERMYRHSANTHMIPATKEIREKLGEVKIGHIIKVKGLLVDVKGQGTKLKSSVTRDDMGDHSSEILWVEEIVIL